MLSIYTVRNSTNSNLTGEFYTSYVLYTLSTYNYVLHCLLKYVALLQHLQLYYLLYSKN
jgi:hypothetical protein